MASRYMASRVAERESMSTAARAIPSEEISPAESLFLLIVDADRWARDLSREVAGSMGFKVYTADNTRAALRQMEVQPVDVVLLDVRQSSQDGIDLLAKFKEMHPQTEIIMVSGHATVDSVVTAMKSGACDFIRKPFKGEELKALLTRAAGRLRNSLEDRMSREHLQVNPGGYHGMLGHSPEMQKLYRIINKVATSKHPVLVQGESGTGKETVARAIHGSGPFHDRPFLLVDCAATADGALENQVFGPIKPASGLGKSKEGLFALASGGTIFFDEIGEMPLDIQGRLVRALQEREFQVQGNGKSIAVDVRIVASTSRDLETAVQQGTFRRDLFFRLNVVGLRLPPLRERKEDIRPLAENFLERAGHARRVQYSINPDALKLLQMYEWPGNVRELENCLERAVAMSAGSVLQATDFPPHIRSAALRVAEPGKQSRILPLAELEKQAIIDALRQLNGDKLMTARALGIGKTTLYRKLKEYGINHWTASPMATPLS
jgi:DNA-binding NtrC family response regulator